MPQKCIVSTFHYSPSFYFTNLIYLYRTRTSRRELIAPCHACSFQLEGCGPTFGFSNDLRVDSMRCVMKRVYAARFFPLFTVQPATHLGQVLLRWHRQWYSIISVPTSTRNGTDFDNDMVPCGPSPSKRATPARCLHPVPAPSEAIDCMCEYAIDNGFSVAWCLRWRLLLHLKLIKGNPSASRMPRPTYHVFHRIVNTASWARRAV